MLGILRGTASNRIFPDIQILQYLRPDAIVAQICPEPQRGSWISQG